MRSARLLLLLAVVIAVALAPAAPARTRHRLVNEKIFVLGAGKTRTYTVGYPQALKHRNARYSYRYRQLPPKTVPQGQTQPDLHKVRVLSASSAQGSSVVQVKVRNGNKPPTARVRIRIQAITVWYS